MRDTDGMRALLACLHGAPPPDAVWDDVLLRANEQMITPYLHTRLLLLKAPAPGEVVQYLATIHDLNTQRNERLRRQILEAARALNAVGIIPMVIKGACHFLSRDQPAFGIRIMTDLDLLVDVPESARALAALRGLGYVASERDVGEHAVASLSRPQDAGEIDLHMRIAGSSGHFSLDALRARAIRFEEDEATLEAPCLTDRCAINIVHDMLHDRSLRRGALDLRRLIDLAMWTQARDGCDWRDLHERFAQPLTARWAVELCARNLRAFLGVACDCPLGATSALLFKRQQAISQSRVCAITDEVLFGALHRAWLVSRKLAPRRALRSAAN